MKANQIRRAVLFVVAASSLALGCELIVDFDRTKIPVEGSDAATSDAATDATLDSSQPDAADASDASTSNDAAAEADAPDDASADAPDGD
jgi:hypothetical protein